MTALQSINNGFRQWLDHVAEAMISVVARLTAARTVYLVEEENGQFALRPANARKSQSALNFEKIRIENGRIVADHPSNVEAALRGGRVELVLRAERFLFKPLELPSRAADFLDGVVRAQIDRLTPWPADQAAYGSSAPADAGPGRIVVTVAATAKAMVTPYVKAFTALGARSIALFTSSTDAAPNEPPIKVLEENVGSMFDIHRARRILLATLAVAFLIALASTTAATILNDMLQARQDAAAHRIAQLRSAMIAARTTPADDPATAAKRALARRKNETPADVVVLEVLSDILPDNTYVTEMRIESDTLRLTGITHDAPALIRLMEESHHFTHTTFFAPTTRGPSDPGDRFNIEARILPVTSPRS